MVKNSGAARDHVRHLPKVLPASASALASSVFLKNETCDPSHLCISATMGLVMPARLKGVKGHPWQGQALHVLMDQFWIRSAIHSHGSTPDRKSRAVPSW